MPPVRLPTSTTAKSSGWRQQWNVFPSIKVIGGATVPGPFHWAGVSDQYFAAVFLPQDPQNAAMVTLRNPLEIPHNASDPNNKQMDKVDVFGAAVGSLKGPTEARLYVGPKALADLRSRYRCRESRARSRICGRSSTSAGSG